MLGKTGDAVKGFMNNLTETNLAYWERNQLVCYMSKLFPSWMELHPLEDSRWENDWRNIVFIRFPEGLFSWHIHDSEVKYFDHLILKEGNSWDGHTSEQKYNTLLSKLTPATQGQK